MKTMLFNPYTGTPRHPSDIRSDPTGALIKEPDEPMRPAADPGPMAATVEEAARDVSKCLNERDGHGLDLRHVAMLVQHAQTPTVAASAFVPSDWQMVPKTCTPEVMNAIAYASGGGYGSGYRACKAWANALAVAPAAPQTAGDVPTVPELIPIAKRKLADLIAAGHVVNGLAFERLNPDGTSTRGAVTVGGMVLWWHPEQQSALYEELRAAIDAGSETATHADALHWVQGAHHVLADMHGLTLTDEQCDAFRRLPMPFNDMVRAIHAAGAEHRTEPAAACWCATDHRNACTGSNEPGQPGSSYP